MIEKYYVITGADEGRDIEPYIVYGSDSLEYALSCYGDACRYYDPFKTEQAAKDYIAEIKK